MSHFACVVNTGLARTDTGLAGTDTGGVSRD